MSGWSVLHDEATIAARVAELAEAIAAESPVRDPLVVGLLTGSFVFVADLVRALARRGLDPRIELVHASHYGSSRTASGRVALGALDALDLGDEAVLVVDDILDSGHTLARAVDVVRAHDPRWLRTCVLLDKPAGREVGVEADLVGFVVPDRWIVGYGLDGDGALRSLPHLAVLEDDAAH